MTKTKSKSKIKEQERRTRAKSKSRSEGNKRACVTSPSPGNQVDGLPGGVSTGAVVASWDSRRGATIRESDMKNKDFDETCQVCCLLIFVFQLV